MPKNRMTPLPLRTNIMFGYQTKRKTTIRQKTCRLRKMARLTNCAGISLQPPASVEASAVENLLLEKIISVV